MIYCGCEDEEAEIPSDGSCEKTEGKKADRSDEMEEIDDTSYWETEK